jgi:23S rRNA pseudouridine1911/1915/1917 synthase
MRETVPPDLGGERADLVVARLAGVSRSVARRLVDEGAARAGGVAMRPGERLPAGTVVEIDALPEQPVLEPEPVAFSVRYEDEHLAVIDKPAGVVVHPGAGVALGTLAAGVLHRWPGVRGVGDENRWGIVHRLDRDTSGLMVVALDDEALRGLRAAIKARRVERIYLALVTGIPAAPTGTIEAPLGRDPRRPSRFRVDAAGRSARTHFRRLVAWPAHGLALLEVRLETGRTHQIRVHAAAIDAPVYGDPVYGRAVPGRRIWLHATRLGFDHPVTGARVEVESRPPTDLAEVLTGLGEPAEPGE